MYLYGDVCKGINVNIKNDGMQILDIKEWCLMMVLYGTRETLIARPQASGTGPVKGNK
jgi:hypothetical protein